MQKGNALFKASHVQDVKYNFSDGNECEPFDSNFSNDSHLLISHSQRTTQRVTKKNNLKQIVRKSLQKKLLMKLHKLQKMEILVLWKYLIMYQSNGTF